MSVPGPDRHDSAADAIRAAADALSGLDARAHVFLEDREDARLRLTGEGARESTRTRSRGAAAVGRKSVHRSDPAPHELLQIAELAAGRRSVPPPALATSDVRRPPAPLPRDLLEGASAWLASAAGEYLGDSRVRIEVRIVRFDQTIWVGRPGVQVLHDARAGHRVEVRASYEASSGKPGEGTVEAALQPEDPLPLGLVDRAVRRARERAGARQGSGRWRMVPAVLAPSIAGVVVHELIGHGLEGDAIAGGGSRLANLDPPVLPRELTVVDDPTLGRAPWAIDDEGSLASRVVLIEGGRVTGVVHDVTTARAVGTGSTGHGRRGSFFDPVLPRLGCTYIAEGRDDPRSILESTRAGVFLRRIVAASVDTVSGIGTFMVTDADAIEQGRLTYPLAPFPIVVDIDESLRSIDAIGDDLEFDRCIGSCVRAGQPVAVSVGAPTIRLGVIKALV